MRRQQPPAGPPRHRLRALVLLLFCLLAALPPVAQALEIALVVSQRDGPHRRFADAFVDAAAGLGHRVVDAGSPAEGVDEAALAAADLVVASGEAAAAAVLRLPPRPTLAVLIGRERFAALRSLHPRAPLSAITLDQPVERQLRLLRAVLPASARLAALLGEGDRAFGAELERAAAAAGLQFAWREVASDDEVIPGLEVLLPGCDALLAVPDPLLSTSAAARAILLTSYRFQKPIVAFSRAYVDAGALAALFSTPEQIAAEVADWLRSQAGAALQLPPPRPPASFEIAVNRQVARALGLVVGDDDELWRRVAEGERS
jgi:hypothetical protein